MATAIPLVGNMKMTVPQAETATTPETDPTIFFYTHLLPTLSRKGRRVGFFVSEGTYTTSYNVFLKLVTDEDFELFEDFKKRFGAKITICASDEKARVTLSISKEISKEVRV